MSGATVAIRLASRPFGRRGVRRRWRASRRGAAEVGIGLDRSSRTPPGLTLGAARVRPRRDPRPLRAPAARLRDRHRRVRARRARHRHLHRHHDRGGRHDAARVRLPDPLHRAPGAARLAASSSSGSALLLGGCRRRSASCSARSASPASAPARSTRSATRCCRTLYPAERRGFAISAHIAGGNIGTVLVPFIGGALLATVGWQATLAVFGIPALVIGALIALLVREDRAGYRERGARVGLGAASRCGSWSAGATCASSSAPRWSRPADAASTSSRRSWSSTWPGRSASTPRPSTSCTRCCWSERSSDRSWPGSSRTDSAVAPTSSPTTCFPRSGSWRSSRPARTSSLLVPLLLPFGTAVFSESPVLQAYLADRATGPMRDVAFSVYFTFAFGIGAFWAFVIGSVVAAFGFRRRSG